MMTIRNISIFYYNQAINHPGAALVRRGGFILFVILYVSLFLEAALGDVLLEDAVGQLVQLFRAEAALSLAAVDLLGVHIMLRPVAAAVRVVEQERLEIVHRVRKMRLRGLVGLEFIEDRAERLLLRSYDKYHAMIRNVLNRNFSAAATAIHTKL